MKCKLKYLSLYEKLFQRKVFCLFALLVILPTFTANAASNLSSFSVFATNSVWVRLGADVNSGNIGVKDASPGPWLDSHSEVSVGHNVYVADGVSIYGDSIKVKTRASAFDVYYNELTNNGTIRGNEYTPLDLPLDITMPAFPTPAPGTEDHVVPLGGSITLDPGSYGKIMVRRNATLILTGGTYHFENLDLGIFNAKVLFQAPTDLIINNRLGPGINAVIGPDYGSGISAKDIRIYVNGINGGTGNLGAMPKAAQIGYNNTLRANIYAPNGTLWIKWGTVAEGAFIGRDVKIGVNVQVTLNSGIGGPGPDRDLDGDGFTENQGDCNDNDATINPDAQEVCDGVDNNCDGQIDEGVKTTYYKDSDSDGYGNPGVTTEACEQPSGYVTDNTDCNDNDANEHPNQTWYKDADNDDYSDGTTNTTSCTRPDLYEIEADLTATSGDCNDGDASINPAAQEICDGVDNNCNGQIDEGVKITYYADTDGDEYGDPNNTVLDCSQPSGYVPDNTDCNDNDPNEHPNQTWYKDADNDGYSDGTTDTTSCTRPTGHKTATELTSTTGDCNDNSSNIHPGATEVPDNGIDEDCNGLDTVTVPNVIGIEQTTAEANITAANLVVGTVTTDNSDTVPADDVINQVPVGNTLVQEGTSVDLVVSLGPSGPTLSSLQIFPSTLVLTAQGEVHQLTVTGVYSDNSTKDITSSADGTTYATTDVNIADVSTEGLAIANNDGSATITISNNAIFAQLVVTVNIQDTPPYDPTAYITGRALDYNTGQPLVGANIKELTLGTIVSTDAEGKFLYPVPQGGKYILFIEKPGYVTAKKEVIVNSAKNTSIEESLTSYETFTTFIDAAAGGVATNAAGTIEMVFPPGALPYDIDISATRLEKEGYPVPLMKGQEFIDSVQFEPEHIDFNAPVTVRFSNIWGFSPGTPIPFAFGSHEDLDPSPEFPYFDPGMGQVSADGQWVEITVSHFSCPSLVLPSCNAGAEGSSPSEGPQNPEVTSDDNKPDEKCDPCKPGCNQTQATKGGASTIYESSGVLQVSHDMVPYKAMGRSNGYSMIYRTDTVNVGSVLAIKESNNLSVENMPSQTTFKVVVEGVMYETHFTAEQGDFVMAYYFDGKNAQGETLKTGAYKINYSISNNYGKNFYTTDSFGGTPLVNTGVSIPGTVPYTNTTERDLIINNRNDSIYGAGWSMSGIERLYPDPDDPDSALLIKGNGSAVYYSISDERSILETVATGLNFPTGIVYDSQGDLLVAEKNNNRVTRITSEGNTTTGLTVSQPIGLAIATSDDLYISTKNGDIYKIDGATNTSSLYVTLPTSGSDAQDIEIDSLGNLYVYDTGGNHFLYKIDTSKQITTLISGENRLLVSSMAISPDDELYLTFNNAGFINCASSWVARYTIDGILVNFSDRLNSPAGITFDSNGTMYVVDRKCGEQEYYVYTIDRFGAKKLFNSTPVGQDPGFSLARLTHDIAWGPGGLAITGTLDNKVYRFRKEGLSPPRGKYSSLVRNDDGTFTRTLKNGTTINYDSTGYQTSWADRNGNTTSYTYDSSGKLQTITDPTGKTTRFYYNNGKIQSITDPAGRTTLFQHDTAGDLISITDPDSSITTYTYNNHIMDSKKVPTGETYTYVYDTYGRVEKSISPDGEVRQFKSGKMEVIVNDLPPGEGTVTNPAKLQDTSLLVNTYTDSEGNTEKTLIDLDGSIIEKTDPLGRVTSYVKDNNGNVTKITRPNDEVENMTYDNFGNLLTFNTESNGATTTFTYEPNYNKIESINDPKSNVTTMVYDSKGNLTKITDPLNNETIMAYDSRGLITSSTDALTNNSTFTYDASWNLETVTDPIGNTTMFSYDEAGNLSLENDAEGKTTSYEYDIVNNLIEKTSADGTKTLFSYDSGERCQPCGASNGGDLLASLTDANNNTTGFAYNEIGQLIKTTNPAGLVTSYGYDTDRKLISKTDPNLQTTTYQYDSANQLTQKDLPGDQVKYYYDSIGNTSIVIDSDSRVSMAYDKQSRLIMSEPEFNASTSKTIDQDTTIDEDDILYDLRDITVDGVILTVKGEHVFGNINIINGATLVVDGKIAANDISVTGDSVITHSSTTTTEEYSLDVTVANTLTIDSTSSIDVSDKGYLGGYRGGNFSGYGRTLGNTTNGGSYYLGGASYGGLGKDYGGNQVNNIYGDYKNPNELGSGGARGTGSNHPGGNGGGLVRITADSVVLNGGIYANAGPAITGSQAGGGSGGGIYLNTGVLSGVGAIRAQGGNNGLGGGGGGGGRIAVYYTDMTGFNVNSITAYGGTNAGAGTLYLKSSIQTNGDLIVDNNNVVNSTPLRAVGKGMITAVSSAVLTDANANFSVPDQTTGALGLIGLELDPNINDADQTTFTIVDNTATTITIDSADGDMTTVAAIGDEYIGVYTFDDLLIKREASLSTDDNIVVMGVIEASGGGELAANRVDLNQATDEIFDGGVILTTVPLYSNTAVVDLVDDVLALTGPLSSSVVTLTLNSSTISATSIGADTITLNNSTISTTDISADTIVLNSNSIITHPSTTTTEEYGLDIMAATLTIDSTSSIDVSDKGYLGGRRGGNSGAYGRTLGNTTSGGSYYLGGGSYGGLGYKYGTNQVSNIYGDYGNPNELGSGGGGGLGSNHPAGNGGGLVRITAGSVMLDGSIYANGESAITGSQGGGGGGGGIYLNTGALSGVGAISAQGGSNGSGGGGGGGGRIAVYYTAITGFNVNNITAYGGTPGGGAGTVYLKSSIQTNGDLIVDNNNITTTGLSTPLVSVGKGIITAVSATVLTDANANFSVPDQTTGALGLIGLELDPNINDADSTTFTIIDNTATTITIDSTDGDMTTVAAIGDKYIGVYTFDDLSIKREASLSTGDNIVVIGVIEISGGAELSVNRADLSQATDEIFSDIVITSTEPLYSDAAAVDLVDDIITLSGPLSANVGTLTLSNSAISTTDISADTIVLNSNSIVTHPSTTTTEEYGLDITATTLTIDSTSSIDVSDKGYLGGSRGGNSGGYGRTLGNTTNGGSYYLSGASYGGLGKDYGGNQVNNIYGDYKNPNELGSGGARGTGSNHPGGNGGGLVRITSGSVVLDGGIYANAGPAITGSQAGGGSGGGIYLNTGALSGIGAIRAQGGSNGLGGGGGGGGRIAVYYTDITGFNVNNITAYGGTPGGGAGTLYLKSSIQTNGDLIVDNNGSTTTGFSTPLVSIGTGISTDLTIDILTDTAKAWRANELAGIYLNPNTNQGTTPNIVFKILSNSTDSITVDNSLNNLTDIGAIGDTYIGEHYIDNLSVINGARVETSDRIFFNSLFITGGELQAENIYQIGKAETKPEDVIAQWSLVSGQRSRPPLPYGRKTEISRQYAVYNRQKPDDNSEVEKSPNMVAAGFSLREVQSEQNPIPDTRYSMLDTLNIPAGIAKTEKENPKSLAQTAERVAPGRAEIVNSKSTHSVKKEANKSQRSPSTLRLAKSNIQSQCASGLDPLYTYDLNGNRASMITPYGTFTYTYDALDRLTSITNSNNEVTTFVYDDINRRDTITYDNGVVTTYSFDAASRLTNMSNDLGATNITNNSYIYDSTGNRTSMTDNYGTSTYQYDDVYRLTNATHPQAYNPTETFTYDSVGNRLTSHLSGDYDYDNLLNRLLVDDTYTYTYDNNGNLTSKTNKTTTATTTYQYDAEDRLVQVTTPTDVIQYLYDGLGRRNVRTLNSVVIKYVYDQEDILFELDENEQIKARYTHGPGIDEPISVDRDTDADGTLDTTYYYHYDGLGSVTTLTDASGNVVQTYVYDAFGNIVNQTGSIENNYTYTGREWDAEAGLYYYRARYYDPTLGRFINGDPIGFAGGDVNFYVYVQNNPVNWIDPDGLIFNVVTGGIGAAVGAAVGATNAIFNGGSILQGALYGAGTGALAGFTFGGSILAQAAINASLAVGADILQQKLTKPCGDIDYSSVAVSGISGAFGGGLGRALTKGGRAAASDAAILSGGFAGIVNVGLHGAVK